MRTMYSAILGAMAGLVIAALPFLAVALCGERSFVKSLLFVPVLPALWLVETLFPASGDKTIAMVIWLEVPFWMAIGGTLGFFLARRGARRSDLGGG